LRLVYFIGKAKGPIFVSRLNIDETGVPSRTSRCLEVFEKVLSGHDDPSGGCILQDRDDIQLPYGILRAVP
jgi:hypothetical protein